MASHSKRLPRVVFAALGVLIVALHPAHAQDGYPSRPIRIIVPAGTGTTADRGGRLVAQGLSTSLEWKVVVENRPGAGSIIGSEVVAKAPADGYTLLMALSPFVINSAIYKHLPYDAIRDFAPITQIMSAPLIIAIHPSVPARNVKEFIAFAKTRPGEISYASAGRGSITHLTLALFASMTQIRMVHVPYSKGQAASIVDVLAGRIAVTGGIMSNIVPHLQTGRLRALGVTTAERNQALPDVPTIAEAGLPGYESVQWNGLLAPAGTPREIVAKLNKEVTAALHAPEARKQLLRMGAEVATSTPEAFAAFIKAETLKWAKVAKIAGVKPE